MQSESEQFEVNQVPSSFFSGLSKTSKLNQKQTNLRSTIKQNSHLATKNTSLQQKIENLQRERDQNNKQHSIEPVEMSQMFKEKVIVEQNQKAKSKKKNDNILTPQPGQKQKTFEDLKLNRVLLKAINDQGYIRPTPIQQLAIPVINSGKDVVASSITGSGKTAAFLLPIIQRYYNVAAVGYIRAMVVTPTRQLAIQIFEEFAKLNKYAQLEAVLVIGASSIQKQELSLRNNPEVVIGTPGRIIDVLLNSRSVGIQNLQVLVFDEADKLLELGFESQIKEIIKHCNQQVQTVMFSATIDKDINRLAHITTKKPIRLSADPDNKTAQKLHQQIVKLKEDTDQYRQAVLIAALTHLYKTKVIVFFKTKKQCHRVAIIMGLLGLKACQLHGNLSQTQRIQAFHDFKQQKYDYLLATDLASRGLDIKQVQTVINFELPTHLTKYIHRIGRTARAGCVGTSLTLCNDNQCLEIKRMSKRTGDRLFRLNVNEQSIKQCEQTINSLYREIGVILSQEREEQVMRRAEMQLQKLENMTTHKDDIYSRPRKEWFMSENEKKKVQEKAKQSTGQILPEPKSKKIFKKNNRFNNRLQGNDRPQRNNRLQGNGRPQGNGRIQGNKFSQRNKPRPPNKNFKKPYNKTQRH